MIFVVATIELETGQRPAFLTEFFGIVPDVLAEEGCLEYGPTIDLETNIDAQPDRRDDVVTVMEKWESLEALEAHLVAPHMLEYRKRVKGLVKSASLQILQPASQP